MESEADREFARLAGRYLDDRAERHPDLATGLGDHRFDDHLPDLSAAALADERRALDGWAAGLEALDADALSAEHRVDAAMMADSAARRVFEIDELAEHTWNPLLANPGRAIYQLLARDFAPLPDRLASVAGRLAEIPAVLAEARAQFAASLPAKAAAIQEHLARGAWQEARRAAHKLRGSAGTYGFAALSAAASEMEEALIAAGSQPDAAAAARIGDKAREARAEAERIAGEGA